MKFGTLTNRGQARIKQYLDFRTDLSVPRGSQEEPSAEGYDFERPFGLVPSLDASLFKTNSRRLTMIVGASVSRAKISRTKTVPQNSARKQCPERVALRELMILALPERWNDPMLQFILTIHWMDHARSMPISRRTILHAALIPP